MSAGIALEINRSQHTEDPKAAIFSATDHVLSAVQPTGSDVLVCIYERPKQIVVGKDALGKDITLDVSATGRVLEDKLQGRVALVVAHGPNVNEHAETFPGGKVPEIGTWVLVNGGDGVPFVGGYKPNTRVFRLVQANFIRLIISDPDLVL